MSPGTRSTPATPTSERPMSAISPNAADFKTVGVSAYDALETHVEKRLSHHFQFGRQLHLEPLPR